jgi:hypothetical protein
MAAIGTERGGRTLALARNLVSYVIAADLIDLKSYDAGKDQQFRSWLARLSKHIVIGQDSHRNLCRSSSGSTVTSSHT